MAKFDEEFEKVILVEGGYVDDPDDSGGETYLGVSRKNNPNWAGWEIIDKVKSETGLTGTKLSSKLKKDNSLTQLAKNLYKSNYWDILELDDVPSQEIAHQLFDTCVNCGSTTAIRIAQQVLGMSVTGKWSDELKHNLMKYGNI